MVDEMFDLLEKPWVERFENIYIEGSKYIFLEKIIYPIHEILAAMSYNTFFLFRVLVNWISNEGKWIQM